MFPFPILKATPWFGGQLGVHGSESPLGFRFIPRGNAYWVDPDHPDASDAHDGVNPEHPLLTLAGAYAKCTDGQNDVVYLVGRANSYVPTAPIVWAKSYTHLIGLSAPIDMGQRVRIVNTAANDLATLFTLSGSGCMISNIQFFDGKDSAADGQCVLVSGSRNLFDHCFFAGMGDATALGPATRAGSYSLKVSGAENSFDTCVIGLDTVDRSAANAELIVSGPRNRFYRCEIRAQSTTAGKFLVTIDNTLDLRDIVFWDCYFFFYTANWAAAPTNAFNAPAAGNTYYLVMKGKNQLVGVGSGWATNVTRMYSCEPQPNAGFGISLNPTT